MASSKDGEANGNIVGNGVSTAGGNEPDASPPAVAPPPSIPSYRPIPQDRRRRSRKQSRGGGNGAGSSTTSFSARNLSSSILRRFSSPRSSDDDLTRSATCASNRGKGRGGSSSFTWAQLARRSTSNAASNDISNSAVDSDGDGGVVVAEAQVVEEGRGGFHSSHRTLLLLRSIKKAAEHPRAIALPALLAFAALAAAGLFAIFHSAGKNVEIRHLRLLEESRELAYELDDVLARALLPLFTLQEMAGQFDEFRALQPRIAGRETYVDDGGRAFRNVTDVCTDGDVLELYRRAAESIVQSSKMGDILINVQLQPAGTVCLNHPPNTNYQDGTTLDHNQAIGLDLIHDKFQSNVSRASINTEKVSTAGPLVLVQDSIQDAPHETLLYWATIFESGMKLETLDGEVFEDYWGAAVVLLDWDEIVKQVGLYEFFEERNMKFALVEVVNEASEDEDKIIEAPSAHWPVVTRSTAMGALKLQARENWELLVDVLPRSRLGSPSWTIWGSILVLLASFLISLALMVVLVSRKDHEELLRRCIPRDIVRRLHTGETVMEKYDTATICFIDIVSFTTMSGRMAAHEVMEMLQILFREFDKLTIKHNCFNAETIGDAYITVSGGPEGNDGATGAANIAAFAIDAVDAVKNLEFQGGRKIKIRVGVASGPVVAGVIGTVNVPKFTLFGETTILAEEMEKTSLPLQVQCSEETMKLLQSDFRSNRPYQCKPRNRDCNGERTWWIVRKSEVAKSDSDEFAEILRASTATITTVTQSEPMQNAASVSVGNKSDSTMSSGRAETVSDRGSVFDFENQLMSDSNTDTKESSAKTRLSEIMIPLRSVGRMFKVAGSNRRIFLGTIMTFAILCGTGLAILYIFANEYEQDKINYAEIVAIKADRWLDKEISKALLPLFAMAELIKIVGKWHDLPFKIEGTPQYNKGTSVFNNVTGICDDPLYRDPFVDMASSIKQSSGMQKILVNVQAAPIGVLCLTYPLNNTEDFPPGVFLDTSGAIGLNLFDTPNRAASSKAPVRTGEKTIQGPMKLAQGNLSVVDEALIARYPVFVDGHNMAIDGQNYPFWGLTIVLMDWDKMKTKFDVYNFFSRAFMQFRMTRFDSWNDRVVVIANSSDHEILDDHNSISYDLETSDDVWTLAVGFNDGFSAPWLGWGTACVIIGSLLLSLLVMMVLATAKMNKMLLYRMMPRRAILAVEQGKTFVERDREATVFFSHLIGFNNLCGEMMPKDFLLMLTQLYTEFDKLAVRHDCTKIETIGAYYIVKGPGPDLCGRGEREGVARIALFALEVMELVKSYQYKGAQLKIRAGFATGPVVSGVIGSGGLPKYTVFGDTVNFSSRMESTSTPMMIQCPHRTFKLLTDSPEFIFDLEEREEEGQLGVYVKGKGQTMTFWLKGYTRRGTGGVNHRRRHDGGQEKANEDLSGDDDRAYDCVPNDSELNIEKMEASVVRDKRVSFKE